LAERQAELSLRSAQIKSLRKELDREQARAERLQNRLQLYTSILDARKTTGVHILSVHAFWNRDSSIDYAVTLVKGGNYPRRVEGRIRMIVLDDTGRKHVLHAGDKSIDLPYRMETHTFLHGSCAWKQNWRPTRFLLLRIDRKGRVRERKEVRIQGEES